MRIAFEIDTTSIQDIQEAIEALIAISAVASAEEPIGVRTRPPAGSENMPRGRRGIPEYAQQVTQEPPPQPAPERAATGHQVNPAAGGSIPQSIAAKHAAEQVQRQPAAPAAPAAPQMPAMTPEQTVQYFQWLQQQAAAQAPGNGLLVSGDPGARQLAQQLAVGGGSINSAPNMKPGSAKGVVM